MNKGITFWIACAAVLFLLSLVWFHQGLQSKNRIFTAWLIFSVLSQVVAAWGLAAGRPAWFGSSGRAVAAVGAALALGAIALAITRWSCPVNRAVSMALAGMLAAQLLGSALAHSTGSGQTLRVWIRNVGFLGPAAWLLIVFSGIRSDRLPLWVSQISNFRWQIGRAVGYARVFFA